MTTIRPAWASPLATQTDHMATLIALVIIHKAHCSINARDIRACAIMLNTVVAESL